MAVFSGYSFLRTFKRSAGSKVSKRAVNVRELPSSFNSLARTIGRDDIELCSFDHQLARRNAAKSFSFDYEKTRSQHGGPLWMFLNARRLPHLPPVPATSVRGLARRGYGAMLGSLLV